MFADERSWSASVAGALVKPSGMGLGSGWGRRSAGACDGAPVTRCVDPVMAAGLAGALAKP